MDGPFDRISAQDFTEIIFLKLLEKQLNYVLMNKQILSIRKISAATMSQNIVHY